MKYGLSKDGCAMILSTDNTQESVDTPCCVTMLLYEVRFGSGF